LVTDKRKTAHFRSRRTGTFLKKTGLDGLPAVGEAIFGFWVGVGRGGWGVVKDDPGGRGPDNQKGSTVVIWAVGTDQKRGNFSETGPGNTPKKKKFQGEGKRRGPGGPRLFGKRKAKKPIGGTGSPGWGARNRSDPTNGPQTFGIPGQGVF